MSRTAHAGRRHAVERVPAALPAVVGFRQPMPDGSTQHGSGRLVAVVLCDGVVHHYRVSLGNGVMQLTPPAWIDRDSRETVLGAGLAAPEEWGAMPRDPADPDGRKDRLIRELIRDIARLAEQGAYR